MQTPFLNVINVETNAYQLKKPRKKYSIMAVCPNKNDIFELLNWAVLNCLCLITVNYRTYIRVRTFSTMLIGLLMCVCAEAQYRSIDGTGNHPDNLGATHAHLITIGENAFEDGISAPAAPNRQNPRIISNDIFNQTDRIDNTLSLSDYVWAFGQFLDHDISLVHDNANESANIGVIEEEDYFEVGDLIVMNRSEGTPGTGTDISNPRTYTNEVTSFIDASMVYGSDEARAEWLRDPQSDIGKLKVSEGNLLPWNTNTGEITGSSSDPNFYIPSMDNNGVYIDKHFVAGDVRANENPLLISLHTVFIREHNRLCEELAIENSSWSGNRIYQEARKKVGAYIQSIAYYEWLPSQGVHLPAYNGYSEEVDPSIFNVFSSAAFRMGHTLINSSIIRMTDTGSEMNSGNINLSDSYFNPTIINISGGIDPFLKGMATNLQQEFDCKMIDDLRNLLFAELPGISLGLDLAAININRGRERGLPDYNTVRSNFGLTTIPDWEGITGDPESAQILEEVYGDINDIDPWVGMLAEEHITDALVGQLVMTIMEKQFQFLRDGDRFYFENDPSFSAEDIHEIKHTKLHDILMRNTDISLMQEEVFEAMPHEEIPNGAPLLPLHLEASAYPNPMDNQGTIKVYMELEEPITMTLYASNGQLLSTTKHDAVLGSNFIPFEMGTEMPRGLYNIKLETDTSFKILRVVKK